MKKIYTLNILAALTLSVAADVPSLINYQGRLVDGVGNPIVGKKDFKLDIYDSQTEGTLIYQETLSDITLDEDGAYSFQFGAGVSRTETSEIIATGDGETLLFQTRLEQTPFGPITVTDGTNSFTQGDVATGEEPFTFLYVRGANRINLVCNDPPATGVSFTATYRYNEAGIVGALGTAAEHWMEVTIGGDKQEPRQRLVAVPFALKAGSILRAPVTKKVKFNVALFGLPSSTIPSFVTVYMDNPTKFFEIPQSAGILKKVTVPTPREIRLRVLEFDPLKSPAVNEIQSEDNSEGGDLKVFTLNKTLAHTESNSFYVEITMVNGGRWAMRAPLVMEIQELNQ
ncbi:hypothetical protein N8686_03560 [Akkermansiaceae bacterium]|nr:hypothetical protein [Akkermansiaceae bacterium]